MDPISALSIVCNIVQLVELGSKVVSEAHEIYTSVEGASDETVTLQTVTDDLSQLTWTLRQSLRQANAGPPLSRDAQALEKLGRACAETAQQLQELLPSFAGSGRPGAWQSARLAIRSLTTRPKRQALLANLRDLRDQLALRINTDIRSQVRNMDEEQRLVLSCLDTRMRSLADNISNDRAYFAVQNLSLLEHHERSTEYILEAQSLAEKRITAAIQQVSKSQEISRAEVLATKAKIERLELLNSLMFDDMHSRREMIPAAHRDTYEWIFEHEMSNDGEVAFKPFIEWMEHGNGIYWFNGKAGSGKSTLMSFVCDHCKTHDALEIWASGLEVATAKFFFWNSGSSLQKSYTGLLRSLLHQCLGQLQELIVPVLGPGSDSAGAVWTEKGIMDAFSRFITSKPHENALCVFIDGLDEYAGEKDKLLHVFQQLASLPRSKICLSSRPLAFYERAFSTCPQLRLQDLTRFDIEKLVYDKLMREDKMAYLARADNIRAEWIVQHLCMKAEGVFLWAELAARSIADGLEDENPLDLLQARLDRLPPELGDLYAHMLKKPDALYRSRASRLFALVLASPVPPTLLTLSLAEASDVNLPPLKTSHTFQAAQLQVTASKLARQLDPITAGLLVLHDPGFGVDRIQHGEVINIGELRVPTVHLLHLTLRDNLVEELNLHPPTAADNNVFNPALALLSSAVRQVTTDWRLSSTATVESLFGEFCAYARLEMPVNDLAPKLALMELFDQAMSAKAHMIAEVFGVSEATGYWGGIITKPGEVAFYKRETPYRPASCFLELCAQENLTDLVPDSLRAMSVAEQTSWSQRLMYHALKLCETVVTIANGPHPPSLATVRVLLEAGADPNAWYEDTFSPWQLWLQGLESGFPITQETVDITAALLAQGADVKHRLIGINGSRAQLADTGFDFNVAEIVEWTKDHHQRWSDDLLVQMRTLLKSYGAECREVVVRHAPHTSDPWATRPGVWKVPPSFLPH